MKETLTGMQARVQDTKTPAADREQLEKDIRKLQREMQDKQEEVRAWLNKQVGDSTKTIFNEIEDMTKRYAASKNLELVLHYSDPATPEDKYSPQMLQLRTTPGVVMPLYAVGGIDITADVTYYLNAAYAEANKAGAGRQ
jgi:Skp family chaperone for outer membrane proteins